MCIHIRRSIALGAFLNDTVRTNWCLFPCDSSKISLIIERYLFSEEKKLPVLHFKIEDYNF